jgi:hypothetical protein
LGNYHYDQDKVALNNACGRTVLKFQVIIGPYFIKKSVTNWNEFLKSSLIALSRQAVVHQTATTRKSVQGQILIIMSRNPKAHQTKTHGRRSYIKQLLPVKKAKYNLN